MRFSPDDALVAASTFSGAVYVVNTATGAVEQELATGTELPVMCVRAAGLHRRRCGGRQNDEWLVQLASEYLTSAI